MQHIKHLYWRAGFGLSPAAWQVRKNWSIQQAVKQLFKEAEQDQSIAEAILGTGLVEDEPQMEMANQVSKRQNDRKEVAASTSDWIQLMADEESSSLKHRMMLFWHGHFACRVVQPKLALQQLQVLERHALGNFRDLVVGIAHDPAMIRYLNNQQNRKQKPNENFARELMELFTIGRGNYTERDVKEAARAFTGWTSNKEGEFIFRRFFHDYDLKTFMGKSGTFDGEEIIDIILSKKETALFITRKIYQHFVNDQIDEVRVQELANLFFRSNYDIGRLMHTIFSSDWFYEPKNIGNQIKSPLVLLAGILRSLPTEFANDRSLFLLQRGLGQTIFDPPNVAGWPGGQSWIDNSTLLLRLNLPLYLMQEVDINLRPKDALEAAKRGNRTKWLQAQTDFSQLESWLSAYETSEAAHQLANYMIVRSVKLPKVFRDEVAKQTDPVKALPLLLIGVMSMPEYQLC